MTSILLLMTTVVALEAGVPPLAQIYSTLSGGAVQAATRLAEQRLAAQPSDRETVELLAAIYNETASEQDARRIARFLKALPPRPAAAAAEETPEPGEALAQGPAYVRATTLRMRVSPATTARVLWLVFLNDPVEVVTFPVAEAKEWAEVRLPGRTNTTVFVLARLLSRTPLDSGVLVAEAKAAATPHRRAELLERAAILDPGNAETLRAAVAALLDAHLYPPAVAQAVRLAQLSGLPVNDDMLFHARAAVRFVYAWVNAGEQGGQRALRGVVAPDLQEAMTQPSCYGEFGPWIDAQDTNGPFRVLDAEGDDAEVRVKVAMVAPGATTPTRQFTVVVRRRNGLMLVDDVLYGRPGRDNTLRKYVAGWRRPDKNGDCGPL